jgi:membrane-bound lytic murein transglycosylase D
MRRFGSRALFAAILIALMFLAFPQGTLATDGAGLQNLHFPKPSLLEPNVEFWKRIYTSYGVGDFVLHDRERLGVIYGVVRVDEATDPARAADLAKPEIQRERAKYQDILSTLAGGVPPEELGPEGRSIWLAWECPCHPEVLRRAAGNIRVQQGLRQRVDKGIQRAQELLPRILAILQEHNVPVELAALPLVESAYDPQAYSKAGAVGLWQFIRSTGKQYLTITRARDDRRDPLRATEAAARLLRHNYEALGSWPLAIVAYNHGRGGILTARAAVGSGAIEDIIARYTGRRFGFASKNFYAEFLAALEVVHPFLAGQGPRQARAHQENAQNAALAVRRPAVTVLAPPAPPAPAAPMESKPPIEAPARPEEQTPAAQPVALDPTSVTPDLPALPTDTPPDAAERTLP